MHTEIARLEREKPDLMTLSPPFWCVIRCHTNARNIVIAKFRSRSAAEGHLQFLAHKSPENAYDLVFDFGLR